MDTNRTFNELLQVYFLERFLYRLSISIYKNKFILKGGMLLYAIFDQQYERSTSDIDLLGENISNDIDNILKVIIDICNIDAPDLVVFDVGNIKLNIITQHQNYNGLRIVIPAQLEKVKGIVHIDIGFGDKVFPSKCLIDFPLLISEEKMELYAYSIETIIAEKMHAIVSLGLANSRLKDFYDIYMILNSININGNDLKESINETFSNRNTEYKEITAFSPIFLSREKQIQWNNFLKKTNTIISLAEVIQSIKEFLMPVFYAIYYDEEFIFFWDCNKKKWLK